MREVLVRKPLSKEFTYMIADYVFGAVSGRKVDETEQIAYGLETTSPHTHRKREREPI